MGQTKSGIINLERYLLYGMILSMATYPIPFLRISAEESIFPIGGLFIPLSSFLLLIRFFASGKFFLNKILIVSLSLLYFSILLASLISIHIEAERIFKLSIFMLLTVLFTGVLTNYKSLRTSLYCIILIGLILAIYGFYGYFTGNVGEDVQKHWWWNYARYWGIHYLPSTRNSDVYYVAIPLIIVSALILYGNLRSFFTKLLLIVTSMIFSLAILLSFSRGAWVSIIVTVAVLLSMIWKKRGIFKRKRLRLWLSIFFGAILFLIIGFKTLNYFGLHNYFIGKMISIAFPERAGYYLEETLSNEDRIEILKATFNIILSNPLGVGPDNLRYFYNSYGLYVNHPENTYLHVLSENGIFGFLGILVFIFYPLLILYKKIKAGYGDWVMMGIFLTSIYLATSYMFNVGTFSFYNWVLHSIIWSGVAIKEQGAVND
ncbi:MAG: O-antigen ligase family protein [Candidatus Omnitrophica bacterium]|nr:O-antigen ligase family protein [Candidatus Omnitrophota bacterium]